MGMVCGVTLLMNHVDNKKPFKPLYIFKHVLKIIPFCLATLIVTNVRDLKTTSS